MAEIEAERVAQKALPPQKPKLVASPADLDSYERAEPRPHAVTTPFLLPCR
jgi:hypothetical protein